MKAYPNHRSEGMDLRDYFAAQAMQAMIAHPDSDDLKPPSLYAFGAYKMADAMMKAREVEPSQTARQFTADETLRGRG